MSKMGQEILPVLGGVNYGVFFRTVFRKLPLKKNGRSECHMSKMIAVFGLFSENEFRKRRGGGHI
jgi:hypothetical protein